MVKLNQISFGATSAIVTNTALVIGLNAADSTRRTVISSILIVALADNITDSLSIHIYQESEHMESQRAFFATLTNFFSRLLISLSFVLLVYFLDSGAFAVICIGWGAVLLALLTYLIARARKANPATEIIKHFITAAIVIAVSVFIGKSLNALFRS